ncbi:MAG: DUF4157 domain-containing protein [Bacteroidia bacterium]|nr:DUF4157 domain-containing protein [Bacteroidia bacterium]
MSKGKEYQYTYIDRARDAQDDWYLQRRKEISSDDFVQTQLEISEPGDTHEQEADRIAQNIVNGQNSKQETITPVSTGIQTKSEGSSLFTDSNFTSQLQQTKGAGQPLDKSIRNEMESKTGSDLSGVKVHTGSAAHALSESINAKAFTHGQDVYFKNGNYDTNTDKGKELLAHEVVHTVQQKAGVRRQIQRSPDGDKAKKELKIILDKKKADNAVKAHQYLKSLSPDVRQEVYDDNEMAKWITWMDENLPVQYLESLDFGFDAGLDKSELTPPDGDTILVQLFSDDATWKEPVKLELLVMMVTQAGLQTAFVPVLQKQWDYLTPEIQAMLKRNGYDNTGYIGKTTGKLTETSNSRMIGNYLFQSGARSLRKGVVGNYLGIGNTATLIGFSLPMFQKSMGGHVSGVHMSDSGETTTKKELKEQGFKKGKYDPEKYVQTSGTVSLHFDRNEGLFFLNAFDLPFDSMNYQFEDQTVRVGKGTIKKANAKYYWEGKKGSSGNEGKIDVDELVLNNIRSIAGDTTIGIGRLALKTLSITVNQPLGNWQTLPSFYEATLACLDQLLNVLFITMDSGLILADHFFKGVGAGANTELQQLVNSMSSALGMTISFDGLILESLVHNKYAFVNKIELGKTDLLFGTDAYITGYNKSIQRIKQKAADEKRELRPEEQAEIDSLQKAIDNEYRIVELSRLVKAVDAKKSADYEKNQQELDSLLAGRQMAFSITTSLFEVGGVRTRSDATRFDLNMASLQSLNVTSTIGSNGLTTINADWGRSEIGHGENIVDPIGAKYKDETQNYKVGTTMDSGAFRWQEGQGHVLRMKNPVFYSGAIGIGPETVVDMEFQRKDITRTTLEMPFVGMPFLKAEEIVLTWPPNGDMLPDVEVWRPEVKDVELVTTQEISISPKQYIDEFYKEKSEEERAKLLKGQLNPVVIWQMSDVLRVSGKIDGKLKLVRNFENQQWILELSSEKEKVSFIGVHIVSEPRGDGMTPTGHRLDTQHFFNDDEDTPYPMKPSYKSKGATETQGETNDKYKFLDDLKNTAISISAFGKTVSIKADDGGFISPVAALNQIYAGFMDEFEKSPIKRNIRAAIRRMAQHLSGSIEPSFTSWALGWSESEAYSILSTPLSMMDQLRFGTVVSGGYYQLAVYIGGVLRSKTKLAIGDNNTLSKDKTKVRLSAFAEYMTQTSKEEKKAEKYDMVSEALNGALDAFAKEWNDYTLDSHIKYSVNYEEPSQAALVQMIDEWWAQAWPVLAAIAPYAYTNYLMGMIAPSMINSLVKMVATSKPAVHFTSDFSFEGAVGMGTFDLSMDSKFNPQVGISDLTIPQLDKSFGDYHVNLTGFEMHGGLLQTNNWNFAKKDFTCTDASLKTFRLTFPIQKKSLSIGSTSDPLEHEADTIASKVASGQNADLTGVQRFFSGVQRKEQEEEVPLDLVQSLESVSGGQNMDEATRAEMESKMGVDFSGVKIHTNSNAHSMNEQVNAKAFTYGQNIFFRNGNYNPNSQSGKELLAHELVHTVQQSSGKVQRKIQRQSNDEPKLWFRVALVPGMDKMTPNQLNAYCTSQVTGVSQATILSMISTGEIIPNGAWTITEDNRSEGGIIFYIEEDLYYRLIQRGYSRQSSENSEGEYTGSGDLPSLSNNSTFSQNTNQATQPQGTNANTQTATAGDTEIQIQDQSGQESPKFPSYGESRDENNRRIGAEQRDEEYSQLPSTERRAITAETDKRFYERVGLPPESDFQLGSTPGPYQRMWKDIRDEVMIDREQINLIPERVKNILPPSPLPQDYTQFKRIAEKLNTLPDEDLQVFSLLLKPTLKKVDLDRFEAFVDAYLQNIQKIRDQVKNQMELQDAQQTNNQTLPQVSTDQNGSDDKTLDEQINEYWQNADMSGWEGMSTAERENLSRQQMADINAIQLQYMIDHPGETAVDFVKGATLMNADEVAEGMTQNINEMTDPDASGWAQAAGAAGLGAKMSGWVAAVACVFIFLSMLTGVGEIAALMALAMYSMFAMIVFSMAESEMRVKAAGLETTVGGFQNQTTLGASAMTNAYVGMAMLAIGGAFKALSNFKFFEVTKSITERITKFRDEMATLLDTDAVPELQRTSLLSEIQIQREALTAGAESAKLWLVEQAKLFENLTPEEFVSKLEAGDQALLDITGIPPEDIPSYRQMLSTDVGKTSLQGYINSAHEALLNDSPGQIDGIVNPELANIDNFVNEVNGAKTVGDLRSAITKYQSTQTPEVANQRFEALKQGALEEQLNKLKDEQKGLEQQNQQTAVKVSYKNSQVPVYRGGGKFEVQPKDIKMSKNGMVKTSHGLSLDVDPKASSVVNNGGAYEIISIPEGLKIIQRGMRAEHFEIVPEYEMSIENFQNLCDKIVSRKIEN